MDSTPAWADELRQVCAASEAAERICEELHRWAWDNAVAHDVLPEELPEPLEKLLVALRQELTRVRSAGRAAFERYSSEPVGRAFSGRQPSREEYYLLLAMGATKPELSRIGIAPPPE
jgi:hypothetical protein